MELRQFYWSKETDEGTTIVRPFTAQQVFDKRLDEQGWRVATYEQMLAYSRPLFRVVGSPGGESARPMLRPDHGGATAWVLGSGPSVDGLDLRPLSGQLVLACNRALRHEAAPERVPYIVAIDDRVFGWEVDRFLEQRDRGAGLITLGHWDRVGLRGWAKDRIWKCDVATDTGWSHDLSVGYASNMSVVSLALQWIAWTGVERVVLVGVDLAHRMRCPAGHVQWVDPQVSEFPSACDCGEPLKHLTHFFGCSPRNLAMDSQNLVGMRCLFELCHAEWQRAGVEVVNVSPSRMFPADRHVTFEKALEEWS